MKRIASLIILCWASSAAANTWVYSCEVLETCEYVDFDLQNCAAPASTQAFDVMIERGRDDFDAKATIIFEDQTMTLDLNGIGHGSPPPILESSADGVAQSSAPTNDQPAQVWALGALSFGTTDNSFLSLTMGYSDESPDTAQLVLAGNTTPASYSATCICVGDTAC